MYNIGNQAHRAVHDYTNGLCLVATFRINSVHKLLPLRTYRDTITAMIAGSDNILK